MIGPDVYESPKATYVSGGGSGLVGKQAAANSPSASTTTSRRTVTSLPPTTEALTSTTRARDRDRRASEHQGVAVSVLTLRELMLTFRDSSRSSRV
jgi:hypothetical protein